MNPFFQVLASLMLIGVGFALYFGFFKILMFMIKSNSERKFSQTNCQTHVYDVQFER